ncbi:MAG: reprolysin-like metallopeptidase, partial [Vicinamibacterales bacterium]
MRFESVLRRLGYGAVGGLLSIGIAVNAQGIGTGVVQAIPLFADVPATTAALNTQGTLREGERRLRVVRVNLDALGGFYGAGPAQSRLELTLFDGETRTAVLDRLETTYEGRSWIGHIEGVELSSVILTVTRGVVAGSVVWPGGHEYGVSRAMGGTHVLAELAPVAGFGNDVLTVLPRRDELAVNAAGLADGALADDPSRVDILAVYTPEAKQEVGGDVNAAAWMDLQFSRLNAALSNSRVPGRARLIRTLEIPFAVRQTCGQSINSLSSSNDGNFDEVHALRDAFGADLVHVFIPYRADLDCAGIAFLGPGPATLGLGLSVINTDLTFAHEIGHNLGATHDWYVDESRNSGKGFVNCAAGWRDVMSYADECVARGLPV